MEDIKQQDLTGDEEGLAAEDQELEEEEISEEEISEGKTVPLKALEEERKKRQELEERLNKLQATLEVYQANLRTPQSPPQARTEAKTIQDVLNEIDDEDIVSGKDLKKVVMQAVREFMGTVVQPMTELQVKAKYPDYVDVITKDLPKVIKEYPDIVNVIQNSPNPYESAYTLTKRLSGGGKENTSSNENTLKKITSNLEKPGVPTKGASPGADRFNYYTSIDDDKFEETIQKIKFGRR